MMQKRTPANTAEMSMLSALVMSARTAEHRSDHIMWKQYSLPQILHKNKKGDNKCHIHREEALTEEGHTAARITAVIHTEAQEEAHATQEAPTSQAQQDMYIIIITDLSMSMQIMT